MKTNPKLENLWLHVTAPLSPAQAKRAVAVCVLLTVAFTYAAGATIPALAVLSVVPAFLAGALTALIADGRQAEVYATWEEDGQGASE